MTQEEKQLLLKDLCARISHSVICQFIWTYSNETTNGEDVIANKDDIIRCIDTCTEEIQANYYREWVDLEHCKPYLRPMSSMTEKEWLELKEWISIASDTKGKIYFDGFRDISAEDTIKAIDYLISHHFDYRGLIEKSLAIVAPDDMYK